jgi:hypothetical protein
MNDSLLLILIILLTLDIALGLANLYLRWQEDFR